MTIFLKRIIKSGWQNFKRGANLSILTCLVLLIAGLLIGGLVLSKDIIDFLVDEAKEKADVSIYLKRECEIDTAFELKEELALIPEIERIEVKSKEEALEEFIEKHSDDESLMESLTEIGYNPFLASVNIKAKDSGDFEKITALVEQGRFSEFIEKVDYHQRRPVIEKIFDFSRFVKWSGLALSLFFFGMAVIVTFTTVRLGIESKKEEISTMRLVGASNSFIQGPFIVQALIWTLVSFLISFFLFIILSYFLTPKISVFFSGFRVFSFFKNSIFEIAIVQFFAILALSVIPTYLAVRKYLKV